MAYLAHAECIHGVEAVNTQQDGFCMVTPLKGVPANDQQGHHCSVVASKGVVLLHMSSPSAVP
jgi:hypothetical protein